MYACLYGSKPRRLSLPRPELGHGPLIGQSVSDVELKNPPWVGYAWNYTRFDSGTSGVSSLNLKTRACGKDRVGRPWSIQVAWTSITDLELKRNGSIAWIAEGRGSGVAGEDPATERGVGTSDRSGTMTLGNSLAVLPAASNEVEARQSP